MDKIKFPDIPKITSSHSLWIKDYEKYLDYNDLFQILAASANSTHQFVIYVSDEVNWGNQTLVLEWDINNHRPISQVMFFENLAAVETKYGYGVLVRGTGMHKNYANAHSSIGQVVLETNRAGPNNEHLNSWYDIFKLYDINGLIK